MVTRRTFLTASGVALSAPFWGNPVSLGSTSAAPETCELALENHGGPARAYVTGREEGTDRWMLLRADGSYYHLEEPGAPHTPLPVDCSIPLDSSSTKVLTLRHMYGARVYFVRDNTLDFFVNPGPSLVEPAFATEADPNYRKIWSFCEFTFNTTQIFVNISYVDLVTALSIGLKLEGDSTQTVAPMPAGALDAIAGGLAEQKGRDGQPWDQLVLRDGGSILRAIAPQVLMAPYFDRPDEMPFRDHWNSYIDKVWEKYRNEDLRVDLQGGRGVRVGRVTGDNLVFEGGHSFGKPVSRDVFTCNHGPFANNPADPDDKKGILARLAAAFNRSTLLTHADQPNGPRTGDYYQDPVTNHWSRIVHANTPIGYAFPYDDVRPDGEPDVSGAVHDGNPRRLTITVG